VDVFVCLAVMMMMMMMFFFILVFVANVGELAKIGLNNIGVSVPDGFAVPFYYYNGTYVISYHPNDTH
jgi:hypothetical protein